MIGNQSDLKVLSIKDYIKNPKESGYKSYHMLVSVPIFLSDSVVDTKVEIQIRTIAMDFWASLEHKIYYKFEGNAPEYISREWDTEMAEKLDAKKKQLIMQAAYAVGGSLMFALGVNLIIIPLGLYNGGFMGIAQLMRTFVVSVLHVPVPSGVDLSGILYFIINIPLFYMGLKVLGKEFAIKTFITVVCSL